MSLAQSIAVRLAKKENLHLDLHLEGNIFTNLRLRNVHATATGPSAVESIDLDLATANYSLFTLIRKGPSAGIRRVEVKSARVVLNPARATLRPKAPPPERMTLPDFFPDRVHISDATLIVRNQPHDFVMEHVDLDLDPAHPGELKIETLQLVGGQQWHKIVAGTAYQNKNLVLRDIVLSPQERIRTLAVDASQIDSARKIGVNLDYPIGNGTLTSAIELKETRASLNADVHVHGRDLPVEFVNKYAAWPENFIRGQVQQLDLDIAGLVDAPRTWNGHGTAHLENFQQQNVRFDRGVFQFVAKDGTATLESGDIVQGQNQFHLHGSGQLPVKAEDFGRDPATINLEAVAPDLAQVTAGFPQHLGGNARITGQMNISNARLTTTLDVAAEHLTFAGGSVAKAGIKLNGSKTMPAPGTKEPWFTNLQTECALNLAEVTFRDYAFDSVEGTLRTANEQVTFDQLVLKRKGNEFTAHGTYLLPEDLAKAADQPANLEIALQAPELADFWRADSPDKVSGPLQMNGQIVWKDGAGSGQLSVYGGNLHVRNLLVRQINTQVTMSNSVAYLNDFRVTLNERDYAAGTGTIDLRPPFRYSGKFAANIADLSTLKPLLRTAGKEKELAGSFVLNWEGNGELRTPNKNTGKLKLALEKGRFDQMKSLQANVDASYSPDGLEVPIIYFASDKMDFQAIATAKGDTFEITKIQLDQDKAKYASGYVSVPFVWKNLGTSEPVAPANGKVSITFQSENLDIKKLFEDFGMTPAASGSLSIKANAQGTLSNLDGQLDLQMRELRAIDLKNVEPATFDMTAQVKQNKLNVNGKLQQARIQPLQMTAQLPFDAARVAREGLADNTPVTARLWLPRTSVNFIRQFIPEVEQLDGDAALDVDVSGTIGKPELKGSGDMTIYVARSSDPTIPAITNFKGRITFARDALTLQQFGGELSGGKFSVSGGVRFPKLTQPMIDITFKADSALVARSDALTARIDADVKVMGPLNSASVTGTVATTNSHFLKNIDLIPIGLPGRPPPQPPSYRPAFSFPQPPVRNWKFDVALKTKEPFKIAGNMAHGGAIADLHLIGTGLHPGISGMVRMENVEATLPFSRLEIAYGFLYFDPSDSFNPKLDLHGTSVLRDYIIHVYVYGTALSPEAVFSSEPPLPQEEIISLLATGTTREELTGNNNVLAGRAATLLVQQLYRKFFKKGGETESNSLFDRLDLDIGQTDPRTGQRQAAARFKLNDQFVLMGDVDVAGGFRGMVKYLIRFH